MPFATLCLLCFRLLAAAACEWLVLGQSQAYSRGATHPMLKNAEMRIAPRLTHAKRFAGPFAGWFASTNMEQGHSRGASHPANRYFRCLRIGWRLALRLACRNHRVRRTMCLCRAVRGAVRQARRRSKSHSASHYVFVQGCSRGASQYANDSPSSYSRGASQYANDSHSSQGASQQAFGL